VICSISKSLLHLTLVNKFYVEILQKSPLEKWDLNQWLADLKPDSEQDDFEMVCVDADKSSEASNESFSVST